MGAEQGGDGGVPARPIRLQINNAARCHGRLHGIAPADWRVSMSRALDKLLA
jgi:hypothetical protein